ncbi:MAG: hypothetical protein U0136_21060 [Bdellovibrionota bacterium]
MVRAPKRALELLALASLTLGAPLCASAQDHNYWNNQFGSQSALLSGAVVGGVNDTSAIFYNPGALGFVDNESLTVSANALRYEETKLENGAGTGEDLDSESVNVVPLLVSGVVIFGDKNENVLGYGLLSRNTARLKLSDRLDVQGNFIERDTFPGSENYIGQYNADSSLNEYWGIGTYARALNDWLSVGFSGVGAVRQESFNQSTNVRVISSSNATQVALTDDIANYDYLNGRLLGKFGMQAKIDPVRLGIALTTPSVSIFGTGTTSRDLSVSNINFDGSGPISFVADDRQKDLDSEFKTPFSVALGADVAASSDTTFSLSTEWFAPVGRYAVLKPESRDFLRPPGAATSSFDAADFLQVVDAADDVFNFALGLRQRFSAQLEALASFSTDYSYARAYDGNGLSLGDTDFNLYHFAIGGIYHRKMSDVSCGIRYTHGRSEDVRQAVNFGAPAESSLLLGEPQASRADYNALSFIVGYTYYFE